MRDLLIRAPVFWVYDWRVLAVCVGSALSIWVLPRKLWSGRAIDWLDAVGLAVYAVFGAAKLLGLGVPPLPAVLMGVTRRVSGISSVMCWQAYRQFCCAPKSMSQQQRWPRRSLSFLC